jgi:PKD repeat protein
VACDPLGVVIMARHAALLVALLLPIFSPPGWAFAATYYVAVTGNDGNTGSADSPWRTIQRAANFMVPGDTVVVEPGVYPESVIVTVSGTPSAPITFQALEGAVLESPNAAASLSAFDLTSGVGHVIVAGFEARGGYHETFFLRAGSHHVAIRDCHLHHNRLGIWIDSAQDIEVTGCFIEHNTRRGLRISGSSRRVLVEGTTSTENDDGLGCSGDADGFTVEETASEVDFVGCSASGNAEDGFDLQGDNVLVKRSEARNNGCAGMKLGQSTRVENSLVVGNTTGISTGSFFNQPTRIEIINSTIADNDGTQLHLNQPNGTPPVPYEVVVRNVIATGPGKAIEAETSVNLIEDHNVLFREDTTSGVLVRYLSPSASERYSGQAINSGAWTAASGQGAATLAIAPDFADTIDYQVGPGSVAIDTGSDDQAPSEDKDGFARPQGITFDRGAFESAHTAANHRPWADPGSPRSSITGVQLSFTAYGSVDPDGDTLTYSWDFGDGATALGYAVSHAYTAPGLYNVTLTASDGSLLRSRSVPVTITQAPAVVHDSVVLAPRPQTLRIIAGAPSASLVIRIMVRNADVSPVRESPGHEIRLVADDGDCPAGTIVGLPDFDARAPGAQDTAVIAGGFAKTATVLVVAPREAFTSLNRAAPHRCTLRFTADTVGVEGNTDPTPGNDSAIMELNVIDLNDAAQTFPHESAITSVAPITIRLRRGDTGAMREIRPRVGNADLGERQGHLITLHASDGDCPAGTLSVADFDRRAAGAQESAMVLGGSTAGPTVPLLIDASAFLTPNSHAPARCTVELAVTGPGGDTNGSNDATRIVVDVIDGNDY